MAPLFYIGWMRYGTPRRLGSACLKYLHIFNALLRSSPLVDVAPFSDDPFNVFHRDSCESQIVSGMEHNDIASTLHRFRGQ